MPREPFAFGGLSGTLSKYGDFDVTAEGAMEFFTNRRKVRGGGGGGAGVMGDGYALVPDAIDPQGAADTGRAGWVSR